MKNKLNELFENALILIQFILALPLMLFSLIVHCCENARLKSNKFSDSLFMKRFRLIDSQHGEDLIKWNNAYRVNRRNNTINNEKE